jgi:hypothetical protein
VSERGINIQAHNVFQLDEDDDFNWHPSPEFSKGVCICLVVLKKEFSKHKGTVKGF